MPSAKSRPTKSIEVNGFPFYSENDASLRGISGETPITTISIKEPVGIFRAIPSLLVGGGVGPAMTRAYKIAEIRARRHSATSGVVKSAYYGHEETEKTVRLEIDLY